MHLSRLVTFAILVALTAPAAAALVAEQGPVGIAQGRGSGTVTAGGASEATKIDVVISRPNVYQPAGDTWNIQMVLRTGELGSYVMKQGLVGSPADGWTWTSTASGSEIEIGPAGPTTAFRFFDTGCGCSGERTYVATLNFE